MEPTAREVAAKADVDLRTVARWRRGSPIRPKMHARIKAAIAALKAQDQAREAQEAAEAAALAQTAADHARALGGPSTQQGEVFAHDAGFWRAKMAMDAYMDRENTVTTVVIVDGEGFEREV